MSDKKLILTVGLPRSGKSTWAAANAGTSGIGVVNPDSIRKAMYGLDFIRDMEPMVWFIAKVMVKALFKAGHSIVILDATSITNESRFKWLGDEYETYYKVFDVSVEECKSRARSINNYDLIEVIEVMSDKFEPLGEVEEKYEIMQLKDLFEKPIQKE